MNQFSVLIFALVCCTSFKPDNYITGRYDAMMSWYDYITGRYEYWANISVCFDYTTYCDFSLLQVNLVGLHFCCS